MSLRAKLARMPPPPAALRSGGNRAAAGDPTAGAAEATTPDRDDASPAAATPPAAPRHALRPIDEQAPAAGEPSAVPPGPPDASPPSGDSTAASARAASPAARRPFALAVPAEFEPVETAEGLLYRRLVRYAASHPVGRGALGPARRARAEGLARLARDPALAPLDAASFLYVDTETTGLAGGTGTIAFLIGMASFDGEGWALEQLLVPEPGGEAPALARVAEAVASSGCLVSYNGKSFDVPLLRARVAMNRLPPLAPRPHLDLMHVARRLHGSRLGRCPLRAVEGEVLGFERPTTITSAEVVGRYRAFLRSGEGALLDEVVAHNAADVVTLVALVALYDDPLASLCAADLVSLARVWSRAGAPAEALAALARAAAAGPGGAQAEALAVGADAARALGDDAGAAAALSTLLAERDEDGVRLRLAKLYEHRLGRPDEALRLVERGTGEEAPALERRRRRLTRKAAAPAQAPLPGFEALVPPPGVRRSRPRRAAASVLALREGEQGRDLRLNGLKLADGELNLGLAQPARGVDEVE